VFIASPYLVVLKQADVLSAFVTVGSVETFSGTDTQLLLTCCCIRTGHNSTNCSLVMPSARSRLYIWANALSLRH